jgi:hypothetical protein
LVEGVYVQISRDATISLSNCVGCLFASTNSLKIKTSKQGTVAESTTEAKYICGFGSSKGGHLDQEIHD